MTQYADKKLQCADCGQEFSHSADEQARFAQLGFRNEPKRCHPCRQARRRDGGGTGGGPRGPSYGDGAAKESFTTRCAECGGEARVPFKPRGDRPVYCSACFETKR